MHHSLHGLTTQVQPIVTKGTQLCLGFYVGDDIVPGVTEGLSSLFAMAPAWYSASLVLTECTSSMLCLECMGQVHLCWHSQAKQWDVLVVTWLGGYCDGFHLGQWLMSASGLVGGGHI